MARRGELIEDVDYSEIMPDDSDYFTENGKSIDADNDSWNSESDTASSLDSDDLQARPVSSLGPKDRFAILQRWWWADADASATWRSQATDDLGFIAGEQLTDEDKAILDAAQRPHVVFNRVLTIIKAIAGMEINGRHEIVFLPEENDDTTVSEVLSGASKWMGQRCDAEDEQSEAFQQCCITGMGFCLSGDAMVRLPNSHFATSRKYSGDIITIDLENGKSLTGTPNHPVLTNVGWKGLGELSESDYLVNSAILDSVDGLPVHQFDDVESRIEDRVNAFRASSKALRFATQNTDFYGDGAGSKVHVVYADGLLWDKFRKFAPHQLGKNDPLIGGDSGRQPLSRAHLLGNSYILHAFRAAKRGFSFVGRHLGNLKLPSLHILSECVSSPLQARADGFGVHIEQGSNGDRGHLFGKIKLYNSLKWNFGLRAPSTGGAQPMSGARNPIGDRSRRYSEFIPDFFDWKHILKVHADNLISINVRSPILTKVIRIGSANVVDFVVHDIGTSLGFFIAGDIITSNTESRWSYKKSSKGEYLEEQCDCREFFWDRTAKKKNLVDARRISRVRRMPLSDALQMFPGKSRRQLDASWADAGIYYDAGPRSIEEKRIRDGKNSYLDWDDTNEVTIVCMQWIENEPYYLVADEASQSKVEMTVKEFRLLKRLRKLQGKEALDGVRMTREVFKQQFLGNEVLGEAGRAPLGNQFSWAVITGEFDAKKRQWFGLTRVVRDPQMWANKFMAQVMHIMNSTAKGGILAERDAFDDEIEAEEGYALADTITWLKNGALSGQRPKIMEKPGKGDASAYVALLQYAVTAIPQVTGVNFELLGQQDVQNPGVVEAMRKQAGMTVLATMFDALRRYRKVLGRIRLWVIQNRMSDGRIIRIVGQQYTGAVQLAKSVTTGEFDVVVDDAPTSPNQKEANWAIIAQVLPMFKDELVQNPELLIMCLEYSPLPAPLISGFKRILAQKTNDPQAQKEQQQAKELAVAKLLAEISKDDSIANMNNAKAGSQQGTAAYDLAIAANMQHDNALQRGKLLIDAKKADADTVLTHAKAAATIADIHHKTASTAIDALNARTKHIQATDNLHTNRVGALAGAHHDLAAAFQKRVAGMMQARTPPVQPNGE